MSDQSDNSEARGKSGGSRNRPTLKLRNGARNAAIEGAGKPTSRSDTSGLAARDLALAMLVGVLDRQRPFDDAIATAFSSAKGLALEPRDRGLARLIAATALRQKGVIETVVGRYMEKPLPPRYEDARRIMLVGAAQILYLDTPPHAAVSLAVTQCRRNSAIQHLAKLVNAVLRRIAMDGRGVLEGIDTFEASVPDWLRRSLVETYGADKARQIAEASLREAPLDLTIKRPGEAVIWAGRLGGVLLGTGTVRLASGGRIEDREGYAEGAWWVQDAAAALPARLLGDDLAGRDVVDLCAAPGGKSAQLAARGANVTAVDVSAMRLKRVIENMDRLGLTVRVVEADVSEWQPGRTFDAVLLDAPCSASGTIRRHPDILHSKRQEDVDALIRIQSRLLDRAAELVAPGGMLVYCTCSLGRAEGESRIQSFLDRHAAFERVPIVAGEAGIQSEWISREGAMRTLPTDTPQGDPDERGMDGFYAARLSRKA